MTHEPWLAIEVICLREACEAIEYGLMEAGALGTETREAIDNVQVVGYYEQEVSELEIRAALLEAVRIYELDPASLIDLKVSQVADRDWLAEWKKDWQPVEVGHFIVAPPWSDVSAAPDQIVIRIEPGMAFGTGTHETTRLCLKAIEKYFRGGSFLDVGTGTGILAIAAAKMFPAARVVAYDTDEEAILIGKENARLNGLNGPIGVDGHIDFRAGTIDECTASANMVCANLTAPVIVDLLPALIEATCGRLVLSGILDSQVKLVETRLRELGAGILNSQTDGEWVALVI